MPEINVVHPMGCTSQHASAKKQRCEAFFVAELARVWIFCQTVQSLATSVTAIPPAKRRKKMLRSERKKGANADALVIIQLEKLSRNDWDFPI